MASSFDQVLDICLSRIAQGETLGQCLNDFPEYSSRLEPLLRAAVELSAVAKVNPSESFRRASTARLMERIKSEAPNKVEKPQPRNLYDILLSLRQGMLRNPGIRLGIGVAALAVLLVGLLALNPWKSFPPPVRAAACTLTELKGETEVLSDNSTEWQQVNATTLLEMGDRVKTGADSLALVTFEDGSTLKMEAMSEISVVESEYRVNDTLTVNVSQKSGQIWAHLQAPGEHPSQFKIQTPAGSIKASGNSFLVRVKEDGLTQVDAYQGELEISSSKSNIVLTSNQQTEIQPGAAPLSPQPLPAPANELVFAVNSAASLSVIDPEGSATGYISNEVSLNQIAASGLAQTADGQVIDIREPQPEVFTLVVRSHEQSTSVNIRCDQNSQTGSQISLPLADNQGTGWLVRLKIETKQGSDLTFQVISIESLNGQNPENRVKPADHPKTPPASPSPVAPETRPLPGPKSGTSESNRPTPSTSQPSETVKPSPSTPGSGHGTISPSTTPATTPPGQASPEEPAKNNQGNKSGDTSTSPSDGAPGGSKDNPPGSSPNGSAEPTSGPAQGEHSGDTTKSPPADISINKTQTLNPPDVTSPAPTTNSGNGQPHSEEKLQASK